MIILCVCDNQCNKNRTVPDNTALEDDLNSVTEVQNESETDFTVHIKG